MESGDAARVRRQGRCAAVAGGRGGVRGAGRGRRRRARGAWGRRFVRAPRPPHRLATTELVLEPAGSTGSDPFSASVAIYEKAVVADAALAATPQVEGNVPGLYGGTQDQQTCDPDALGHLPRREPGEGRGVGGRARHHPGGDPRLRRHAHARGAARRHARDQSRLHRRRRDSSPVGAEAGTAVLVDNTGAPRVRCSCGNPLLEPEPLGGTLPTALAANTVTLVGQPWAGWNPQQVVVVNATVVVNQFVVWDLINGGTYAIEIGGAPVTTTTTEPPTTTTTAPPSTTTTTTAAPTNPSADSDCRNDPPIDYRRTPATVVVIRRPVSTCVTGAPKSSSAPSSDPEERNGHE